MILKLHISASNYSNNDLNTDIRTLESNERITK
jgi:cell division protein FtsL